jgi:DNA-binding NtrC family response regulator
MMTTFLLGVGLNENTRPLLSLAGARTGHAVHCTRDSHEAFAILERRPEDMAAIIIDLNGIHGATVLDAMHIDASTPPIIALSNPTDPYLNGLAAVRDVAAVIDMPCRAAKLGSAITKACQGWQTEAHTCDAWGHPHLTGHLPFAAPGRHHFKMQPPTAAECANL